MAGEQRIQLRRGTSAEWASANPTLSVGEVGVDTTLNRAKIGDGATAWDALQFLRTNSVTSVSADYTITGVGDTIVSVTTGGTNKTITLPASSAVYDGTEVEVHKADSGTGKVTLSRAGSDTIDGVTSIDIDSQYDYAKLKWSGGYWALVEYKDHGSGTFNWRRNADGTLEQWATGYLVDAIPKTITFDIPYIGIPSVVGSVEETGRYVNFEDITATTCKARVQYSRTDFEDTRDISWRSIGRWRA